MNWKMEYHVGSQESVTEDERGQETVWAHILGDICGEEERE